MAQNDAQIARDFVLRKPINKKLLNRVRFPKKGLSWSNSNPTHGMYPREGAARFSYDEQGCIWSYEAMELGRWLPDGTLLINGDNGASMRTREHQSALRSAVKTEKLERTAIVPYSALRAAGVRPNQIEIVATTPDREVERTEVCRKASCPDPTPKHTHTKMVHFLGETLFKVERRAWDPELDLYTPYFAYFVCGLDRNDDPMRRNFFLAQLPEGVKPTTVDDALNALRPNDVPADALRQGEWFFLPTDKKFGASQVIKNVKAIAKSLTEDIAHGVPIVSDDSGTQYQRLQEGGWNLYARRKRHRASRMVCSDGVYVSGMIRDEEHDLLRLGDGKQWFRVVRNLSPGSWKAGGDVD